MTAENLLSPRNVLPEIVGVLGGGRMGSGISHAFLLGGSTVVLVERNVAAARDARQRVVRAIDHSTVRGQLTAELAERARDRLVISVDPAELAPCGLVIEAVPELPHAKVEALAAIERNVSPEAMIASNTSSMSLTGLAEAVSQPERFLGLHFFNPVPASALIEVVAGAQTAPERIESAVAITRALGKTPIVVRDAPGFASSRLGVVIALEAMRMLEAGVASAEDIDAAMVLGYQHPVGPLRLTDLVGLDVRLGIAEYLARELGERFSPPQILRDTVAAGHLGRKSGRGFYDWSEDSG